MDVGWLFDLESVQIKLDDKVVANYLYTAGGEALHRGGVQRVYLETCAPGEHSIDAFFTGKQPARPRLQARHHAQVREGHRSEVHRAAHPRRHAEDPARVRGQGLAVKRRLSIALAAALVGDGGGLRRRRAARPARGAGPALRATRCSGSSRTGGSSRSPASWSRSTSTACSTTPTKPRCCAAACCCQLRPAYGRRRAGVRAPDRAQRRRCRCATAPGSSLAKGALPARPGGPGREALDRSAKKPLGELEDERQLLAAQIRMAARTTPPR